MKKILIVEDDLDLVGIFQKKFLNQINLEVEICTSYLRGIAQIINEKFYLYVIDYRLNEETGFDLIEVLNKHGNMNNRIIMISGEYSDQLKIRAYNLGVSNYLAKPLNFDVFNSVINKNLRMLDDRRERVYQINNIKVDLDLYCINEIDNYEEVPIVLTPTDYKIVVPLTSKPNLIITYDEFAYLSKDDAAPLSQNTLKMHIYNIKSKSKFLKNRIKNKNGFGYFYNEKND